MGGGAETRGKKPATKRFEVSQGATIDLRLVVIAIAHQSGTLVGGETREPWIEEATEEPVVVEGARGTNLSFPRTNASVEPTQGRTTKSSERESELPASIAYLSRNKPPYVASRLLRSAIERGKNPRERVMDAFPGVAFFRVEVPAAVHRSHTFPGIPSDVIAH
ncbi:hypothetical protein KM043_006526 [Ampulex compressa]|nr:hypothetical protein KM043_006526 [Ampulex compressa]